jgi:hypothetical protein
MLHRVIIVACSEIQSKYRITSVGGMLSLMVYKAVTGLLKSLKKGLSSDFLFYHEYLNILFSLHMVLHAYAIQVP